MKFAVLVNLIVGNRCQADRLKGQDVKWERMFAKNDNAPEYYAG